MLHENQYTPEPVQHAGSQIGSQPRKASTVAVNYEKNTDLRFTAQ